MLKCPKCFCELSQGSRFCPACGAQINENNICTSNGGNFNHTQGCSRMQNPVQPDTYAHRPNSGSSAYVADAKNKKGSKKIVVILIIVALVLALALAGVLLFAGNRDSSSAKDGQQGYNMYVNEGALYFDDYDSGKTVCVDDDYSAPVMYSEKLFEVSDNRQTAVYMQNPDYENILMVKNLKDDSQSVEISRDVTPGTFDVSPDGKYVVYVSDYQDVFVYDTEARQSNLVDYAGDGLDFFMLNNERFAYVYDGNICILEFDYGDTQHIGENVAPGCVLTAGATGSVCYLDTDGVLTYVTDGKTDTKELGPDATILEMRQDGKELIYVVPNDEYTYESNKENSVVVYSGNSYQDEYDLYTLSLKDGSIGNEKFVDDGIIDRIAYYGKGGKIVYAKNCMLNKADIYVDGKMISAEADMKEYITHKQFGINGIYAYTKDTENGETALFINNGYSEKKVDSHVLRFFVTPDGDIVYTAGSVDSGDYTLKIYTNGRTKVLCEDYTSCFYINDDGGVVVYFDEAYRLIRNGRAERLGEVRNLIAVHSYYP